MKKFAIAAACACLFTGLTHAAGPALNRMLDSVKLSTASIGFLADLDLARSEAFSRNASVVMCKSGDGESCSASGAWDQGWIVFVDANGNGLHEHGEKVIVRSPKLASNLRFSGDIRLFALSPAGSVRLVGVEARSTTLTVCRESGESAEARRITVAADGVSQMQRSIVGRCT